MAQKMNRKPVSGASQTAKTGWGRVWYHDLTVIGLRFRMTRAARRALADKIAHGRPIAGIRIVREPDNRADADALAVYLPKRVLDGRQIGYLRKEVAEILAPRIDAGNLVVTSAKLLNLDADDDWNTGELVVGFRDRNPSSSRRKTAKN